MTNGDIVVAGSSAVKVVPPSTVYSKLVSGVTEPASACSTYTLAVESPGSAMTSVGAGGGRFTWALPEVGPLPIAFWASSSKV